MTWLPVIVGFSAYGALLLAGILFRSEDIIVACVGSAFVGVLVFGPVAAALLVYQLVSG